MKYFGCVLIGIIISETVGTPLSFEGEFDLRALIVLVCASILWVYICDRLSALESQNKAIQEIRGILDV